MPVRNFIDKYGRDIAITFDEDLLICEAHYGGELIGTFRFIDACPDEGYCRLLLTHCHLEKLPNFKQCGIGEQMLLLPIEFGYSIFARHHDGIRRDDGSHLTEDAPAFIAAMVNKGIVMYFGGEIN